MIICNDVMTYMFGFCFGKTWEGFIGGGFATVIFGMIIAHVLCPFMYLVCPIQYSKTLGRMTMECTPSYLFTKQEYSLDIVSFYQM